MWSCLQHTTSTTHDARISSRSFVSCVFVWASMQFYTENAYISHAICITCSLISYDLACVDVCLLIAFVYYRVRSFNACRMHVHSSPQLIRSIPVLDRRHNSFGTGWTRGILVSVFQSVTLVSRFGKYSSGKPTECVVFVYEDVVALRSHVGHTHSLSVYTFSPVVYSRK